MSGFLKIIRGELFEQLLYEHPNEHRLLTIIAYRARRSESLDKGLKPGDALIGDWEKMGFSRQTYRTTKTNLQAWGLITTRATTKGTVATICGSNVFDINSEQTNHQTNQQVTTEPTINQPAGNHRLTTNKKVKKGKNGKEGEEKTSAGAVPESSDHCKFIRLYAEGYRLRFQCDYAMDGGRDGRAVKLLTSNGKTPEELFDIAKEAWDLPNSFLSQAATSLSSLQQQFSKIQAAVFENRNKKPQELFVRD